MFEKILIANRGEIALRVIRACKELGIRTLAVYSEADVDSLHVQLADESICIGAAPSADSYLKIDRIMSAAEVGDVDAIHPGYGFLAENAHFAEVCESCKIKFIGPTAAAMRAMGDKNSARAAARKAGVPVTPGQRRYRRDRSRGDQDRQENRLSGDDQGRRPAAAVAGCARRITKPSLVHGFHSARMEAEKAFGNAEVYIEKLIVNPHHIEFQIMADNHGNIVHLGERDCSIQRRNQKVIEECPSPLLTPRCANEWGTLRSSSRKSVDYVNAGTMEFLVDQEGTYYFIEMNTRIQVEHTITEEVYGCDLVKEQIHIAAGDRLSPHVAQAAGSFPRHPVPDQCGGSGANFQPSAGRINFYYAPGGRGVRIDSHAYTGYTVPPHYDSMIAKLIAVGATRESAIARMRRALGEYLITGIKTTIPFHNAIMRNADFATATTTPASSTG